MATTHAWFSAGTALRQGSSVYRKPDDSTVNVTRVSPERESKGSHRQDEQYLGQVIAGEDGGCVSPLRRVDGITR